MTKIYFYDNNHLNYYNIYPNVHNINKLLEIDSINSINIPIDIKTNYIHVGPIKHFRTPFSSNVFNILNRLGIDSITNFEHVKLYDVNSNYTIDTMLECDWSYNSTPIIDLYPTTIKLDNTILNRYGMNFDNYELEMYKELYSSLGRDPTFIEIYDLCQSNSEHSRHWFFKGKLYLDNKLLDETLFDMVKSTLNENPLNNSLVAFSDNSSVIEGFKIHQLLSNYIREDIIDIVLTAETHNFPTLICPFQGANTGVGGRIRDNHATGRGANIIGSLAGYCVGSINLDKDNFNDLKYNHKHPLNILIEASNGASDYGNKIGEPIIGGFTRSYGNANANYEWIKPIMFSAGIGSICRYNLYKIPPKENVHIIRIGGPAYKIGLGGGFSSSLDQDGSRHDLDLAAVQRGDPQMCNKLNRVIKICSELYDNPILSIHDQGAGGLANVVKEIAYPNGAVIYLDNVTLGDVSMKPLDIWCSEFQESDVILVENVELIEIICKKENICCDILGTITNTGNISVWYKDEQLIDLPLKDILEPNIQKEYYFSQYQYPTEFNNTNIKCELTIEQCLEKVLGHIDVGSKRFLTNKVDRSVSGQIVQQQCVGPFHTPISNYSLVSLGYFDTMGAVSAIGEKPILGITDPKAQASMSIGEMITNIMGVYIGNINKIKCSANWMWPASCDGEKSKLYEAAKEMCYGMKQLGIAIDGGKDSLSMSIKDGDNIVKSPGQLVITGYAPCPDIYKHITPNFKKENSNIVLIKFTNKRRLGASIFSRTCLNDYDKKLECPRLTNYTKLLDTFNIIQTYILTNKILSLHDVSDGGLITTLCEMAISSNIGINLLDIPNDLYSYLFNEELGIVCEIEELHVNNLLYELELLNINCKIIGNTTPNSNIIIFKNGEKYKLDLHTISKYWEMPSFKLEQYQSNHQNILAEYSEISKLIKPIYYLPSKIYNFCKINNRSIYNLPSNDFKLRVGIIRDDGSNGDKEMCAALKYVGFDVYDIHMDELLEKPEILHKLIGLVYVGGFSHGDVLGASHGWYLSIKYNEKLSKELDKFMKRCDTFSLGVCNGCQLMVKQKIFGDKLKLVKNDSKRFESRFSNVTITNSNNIFFKNMENMSFGIWVAHGEGKFINVNSLDETQKVLKYTNTNYPNNPNGSQEDLAGVCYNGRHLAMMPHPERSFLKWQLPYLSIYDNIVDSPWLMMFANIYEWSSTI